MKGVLQPADIPGRLLFQAVGSTFDAPRRFTGTAESGLVLILRDLAAADIAALQPDFPAIITARAATPFRPRRAANLKAN